MNNVSSEPGTEFALPDIPLGPSPANTDTVHPDLSSGTAEGIVEQDVAKGAECESQNVHHRMSEAAVDLSSERNNLAGETS